MGKAQSPLLGFNNNVRHRGRVFHIQTEDSGIKYPHVITHLFADGGRILKSIKTSYAEYLDSDNLQETVRNLMKDQHKSMFIALRDGQFDEMLEDPGQAASAARPAPAPAAPAAPAAPDAPAVPDAPAPTAPTQAKTSPEPDEAAEPAQPSPTERKEQADDEQVDVETLERAAKAAQSRSPLFGSDAMPPPPPSLLAKRPSGSYRAVGSDSTDPGSDKEPSGRYSASRPASIFGTAGPSESSGSVFGEDMISGKSLDEVILSFLAEEFGDPPDGDDGGEKK
ncbi:MAG: hypothetical protein ACOC1F_08850 [Myxococcota bacterium]